MRLRLPEPRLILLAVAVLALLAVFSSVFSSGSVANAQEGVPDKPEGLTGRLLQFGSAELDWKDVQGAETYEAQYWDNTDASNNFWADPPSIEYDGSSAVLSGLPNQNVFYFQVRARNSVGPSEWSDYILVKNPNGRGWLPTIVNICDRTPEVRDAIRSSFPCDEVTHTWLSSIRELRLDDREITALTADDFAGLSNLTYLDLRRNYVEILPEGVFDDLTNLEKLYLGSPFLREVPDDAFANSPNLEELDLYASPLTRAPAAWFAKRTSLKRVNLGGMKLTELPDDPFEGLSNLEWLHLAGNDLTDLPDGTFDGLTNLEELDLEHNPLNRASAVWFEDLSSLEVLEITLNDLSDPPDNVFANLSSLKELWLVSGTLFFDGVPETELSADWFEDLSHLEELHVYGYLSTLPDGVFANLTSLKELDLGFNRFTEPSADWFKGLSNLERLRLTHNDLSELSVGWAEHLTKLKDLDLAINAFSHLSADWFQGLDKLERLNLRNQGSVDLGSHPPKPRRTHLRQLPDRVFVNLPNLRELNLVDNSLSTLPANVFEGLSNLEYLGLDGNSLDSLPPDVFEGLTKLELLGFFGNELTSLPDGLFDGLSSLSFVSFLYNPGAPFTFTAQLEAQGSGAFVVKVAQGAPLPMEITFSTEDGILSRDTITLTPGRVTSDPITVTTDDAHAGQVQINVTSAAFDSVHAWRGLNAAAGQPLYVNAPPAGSNAPATGAPTIGGTAQVGETLTADTSGIGDADGLSGTIFSYQWLSSRDTEIPGATDSTYTLLDADAGKTIKVRVTFTDDAGHDETLISAPTAVVAAATPQGICDRTQQVQDAILGVLHGVDDCSDVTDAHLAGNVTGLWISTYNPNRPEVLSLKSGDFAGLVNMKELGITYYDMDTLPEDIFAGLSNLKRLDLANNRLSALPEDVFDGLDNLESLDLESNQLSSLPADVFDGLGSLKSLTLFANGLSALPADVFDGLGSLTSLRLSFNRLSALPEGVFDGLGSLTSLRLSFNRLSALPEGVFNGLGSLESLRLNYNEIRALPKDVFDGLGSLEALHLDSNHLGSPPEDVFDGLDSLTHLYLSDNRISTLREDLFDGLANLEDLSLHANQISVLPEGVFDGLGSLRGLSLDNNQISALPDDVFNDLGNLTYLGLRDNQLGPLPEDFFNDLGNLTSLDLSDNRLGALPEDFFDELGNLTFLALGNNQIRLLPEDVFDGLGNLEGLWLDRNQIGALPENVFDGLGNLDILLLQDNPGSPFTFTAELEQQGENSVVIRVAQGAPFEMTIGISALGGTLSSSTTKIKAGHTTSKAVSVTPRGDGAVTVSVQSAEFPRTADHSGIQTGLGQPLVLGDAESVNTPATGAPTISGTAQVGETLTADTSGIADADGLANVSYSYQWLSSRDTEIQGATDATYTLVAADAGKTVKVRVSFTDDAGNPETLTSTATDEVAANTPVTGLPGNPGLMAVYSTTDNELEVRWSSSDHAATTEFKVHWKSGAQDYDATRQALVDPATSLVPGSSTASSKRYKHTITGLTNGVEYTVRVVATNSAGDSRPSPEATGTPQSEPRQAHLFIKNEVVNIHEGAFPWLRDTWDYMTSQNVDVYMHPDNGNSATVWCSPERPMESNLRKCYAGIITIDRSGEQLIVAITHELAHVYTLSNSVVASPGTLGIAHLYLYQLNLQGISCEPEVELYADLLSILVHGDLAWPHSYWKGCYREEDPDMPDTEEVLAVVRSAVAGEMPSWLAANYSDANGDLELERVWADIKAIPVWRWRAPVVFQLRDAFGGYCDNRKATDSAFEDGVTKNPWRDGGCVPDAPGSLNVTAGDAELSLSWEPPEYDGGSPVEGYRVQWKSSSEEYDDTPVSTRRAEIADLAGLTHTITGLTNGIEYTVQVLAYNHNGVGMASVEVTAKPEAPNSPATSVPTIDGTAQVGKTLTAYTSDIEDADGLNNASFSYQWIRNDGGTDADIQDATGQTYTLVEADQGKSIKVRVSFTDDAANPETLTSAAKGEVEAKPNSPAEGQPSISGTAQVGQTLTAGTSNIKDADGLVNAVFSYQWLADDANIQGATNSTYTLSDSDAGKAVKVKVSFTDDAGHEETLTSAATGAVAAVPPASGPAVAIGLSPSASVAEGTEITVTMSFANLESDSDTADTDYIFRADVVNAENGDADACEGGGMGKDRYMYKVDEDPEVRTGAISASCAPGDYTVQVSISSSVNIELASATTDFTVAAPAQQPPPEPPDSTDATLSGLTLSNVDFGAFASSTTEYTADVANDVDETTVTPTTNDDGATHKIKLGGVADEDGMVQLSVGSNVITIEVTAKDGNTIKTYTITVTRAAPPAPGPAVAIALAPSGSVAEGTEITVTMSFASLETDSDTGTTDYIFRADVVNADGCEGGGMGVDRYMYKVDEDPEVRAGTISASCAPGDYTVAVSISSPGNGELASATAGFTVTEPGQQQQAQEPPPSTDATLSGLTLSDVTLAFASTTTDYTASVANDVTQTTVTPTVNDDGASYAIKLDGVADADGTVPLAVGSNVITVDVTAEDGNTAKTYTVTVTRAEPPSTDATLKGLTLSGVNFGKFDPATTGYDVDVAHGVDETTVTPTTNNDGATYAIKLDGVTYTDGVVPLAVGSNVITVEVTAEDGETTKTYTATVVRAEPPSTDATLKGLALSNVNFGAFDSATAEYTASVANDVDETTVTLTVNDDAATYAIKLGGVTDDDATVELSVGANTVSVVVTAEDGNTAKTYTVTVTRAEAPAPEPTVAIELSSDSVEEGTEITVTMSFANLTPDNDANLVFRADVVGADDCEGQGIGVVRNISKVDEDPEVRTGTISGDCAAGDYTLEVSLSDDEVELASARADFAVVEPEPTAEPKPTSPPDAPDTPTGEVTGKGRVQLDWNDVAGATHYQVRFYDDADWVELPTDEISLVLDGSGATASNLPDYGFYYFAVRAGNAAGVSEWSDFLSLPNPEQ